MTNQIADIDALADELLEVLDDAVVDFLDTYMPSNSNDSVRNRLIEWFISKSFRYEMVQTLTEFLGVKDARRLYQKGQVNGRTDRFHPSEYVNQWLARHRIPELVFPDTPATVLRDLRKISLSHSLCGGNKGSDRKVHERVSWLYVGATLDKVT
jgi:hypothetical protein